jgi:putative ATP-binding cassette transporter
MPTDRKDALFGRRFARAVWRLIRTYWSLPEGRRSGLLLAGAIALELAAVYASVLLSGAERRVFDALERRESMAFLAAVGTLLASVLGFVLVSTYRIYLRQALEIRWRRGLTGHYLGRWVGSHAYLQDQLHPGEIDNPDQRVQEDVRDFVASALGLSLSLLSALATLLSFGSLLWTLSGHFPLRLDDLEVRIPGLMLWVAIAYAALSIWITHLVGRCLVGINFDRLRVEADFRYGLVRFRDNLEPIALSRGEAVERLVLLDRFHRVVGNWWELIRAQRNLSLTTGGIGQINGLVPLLVAAPAFLAGHLTLGSLAQIRFAYGQVSGSLTWFVNAYQEIARWRANIERLATFEEIMDATAREIESAGIRVIPTEKEELRIVDLHIRRPDGYMLLDAERASIEPGDRVAVTGPSACGKTLLMRAIAGLWPFGSGRIEVPAGGSMLFLPEQPYLPIGTLRAAVSFPRATGSFSDERIRESLRLLGLGHLEARLDDLEPWESILSPQEQQRVALTRVLLHQPDWVFLDKATSAMDEDGEARIYDLLVQRLPRATFVSVDPRGETAEHHPRRWTLSPGEDGQVSLRAA